MQNDALQTPSLSNEAAQVLMLGIGDEIFAIDASLVREIIDPVPETRVAGANAFLPSVINVRGNVIPLADLRIRFGMAPRAPNSDTRFVVIEVVLDDDPVVVAITADKVHEVTEISRADMQATPRIGMQLRPEFVRFIAKWKSEFVTVPDLQRIFN